jgi:hypothetical protein
MVTNCTTLHKNRRDKKQAHFHPSLRGILVVPAVIPAIPTVIAAVIPNSVLLGELGLAVSVAAARSAAASILSVSSLEAALLMPWIPPLVPPSHFMPLLAPVGLSPASTAAAAGTAVAAAPTASSAVEFHRYPISNTSQGNLPYPFSSTFMQKMIAKLIN